MGCLFSRNELKIEIFDLTPPGDDFDHLRSKGTITFTIDRKYNVPLIDIRFDGWYENSVRLWPNRERFFFLKELLYRHLVLLHRLTAALILFFSLKNNLLVHH